MKKKIAVSALTASLLFAVPFGVAAEVHTDGNETQEEKKSENEEVKEAKEVNESKETKEEKKVEDESEEVTSTKDIEKELKDSNEEVNITAKSAILYDFNKKKMIYEKNTDEVIPTASLAKVMTLYITLQKIENGEISLQDEVTVSERAWRSSGSKMFLNINAKITVEDLIRGVAIVSGNDGAITLAEYISGDVDSFVKEMNKTAKALKMSNTTFKSPNGLGDETGYDTSTAGDLMKLAISYVEKYEKYLHYHQEKEFTTTKAQAGGKNDITQKATNGLLESYEGTLGLKTGFVEGAYNLIGVSERQGIKVISVVLSSESSKMREKDTAVLFDYGFSKYRVYTLAKAGQKLETLPVYKAGDVKKVDVVIKDDVKVTIHQDERGKGKITETMNIPEYLKGGLEKSDVVGEKVIKLDGKEIAKVEYTVAEKVPEGSFLSKTKDNIYLFFRWIGNKF